MENVKNNRILVAHPLRRPYGISALVAGKKTRVEKWFDSPLKRQRWVEKTTDISDVATYNGTR